MCVLVRAAHTQTRLDHRCRSKWSINRALRSPGGSSMTTMSCGTASTSSCRRWAGILSKEVVPPASAAAMQHRVPPPPRAPCCNAPPAGPPIHLALRVHSRAKGAVPRPGAQVRPAGGTTPQSGRRGCGLLHDAQALFVCPSPLPLPSTATPAARRCVQGFFSCWDHLREPLKLLVRPAWCHLPLLRGVAHAWSGAKQAAAL